MDQIFSSSGPHQTGWEALGSNLTNVTLLIKFQCVGWSPNPSSSGSFLTLLWPLSTTPFQHWLSVSTPTQAFGTQPTVEAPGPINWVSLSVFSTQLWKPAPKPQALPYSCYPPVPPMTNCHRMAEWIKPGRGRSKCPTSADLELPRNTALCLTDPLPEPKSGYDPEKECESQTWLLQA